MKKRIAWNKNKEMFQYSGNKHWNWKGGKPKCVDCGKQLVARNAKRCQKHANTILLNRYRFSGIPWNKGLPMSLEAKRKVSLRRKGQIKNCLSCQKSFYTIPSAKDRKYCSIECIKRIAWNKGKPNLAMRGENNPNWKGGITPINKKIRKSLVYKQWRETVFKRDDYICQMCGIKGGYLEADHIKPFAKFSELRFEISNGQTLHKSCHILKGMIYRRNYKILEDILLVRIARKLLYG